MSLSEHFAATIKTFGLLWKKFVFLYILIFLARVVFLGTFSPQMNNKLFHSIIFEQQTKAFLLKLLTVLPFPSFALFILMVFVSILLTHLFSLLPLAVAITIVKNRRKHTSLAADLGNAATVFISLIITHIVGIFIVLGGFLVFIVPGILLAFSFMWYPWIVVYHRKGGVHALTRSISLVRNNWRIILLHSFAVLIPLVPVYASLIGMNQFIHHKLVALTTQFTLLGLVTFGIIYLTLLFEIIEN